MYSSFVDFVIESKGMEENLKISIELDTEELERILRLLDSIKIAIEDYLISKELSKNKEKKDEY
jgi:hypothetical protein